VTALRRQRSLREEADALAPWFHNLHLPGGVETAPDHHFGDFPRFKWREIAPHLPEDLTGARVLDIGCNAGFYAFALAERGASVLGLDVNVHYIKQAIWAADVLGLADRVSFRRLTVYEAADLAEPFDIVLFMGLFYHLRYPLLALDCVAALRPDRLVFQTLTFGPPDAAAETKGVRFQDKDRLEEDGWPKMAFVEEAFAEDRTNWWIPNPQGARAMLAAAGFRVEAEPSEETFVCRFDPSTRLGHWDGKEFAAARGMG